jgi:hypothetical protein
MDVEKIERLGFSDFRHFHREGQSVIGAGEDGGVSDVDLVKMNSRQGKIEPDRFGVAEEMDVVTPRREFHPERSRQDPAAADERKTGNPDLERLRHFGNGVGSL